MHPIHSLNKNCVAKKTLCDKKMNIEPKEYDYCIARITIPTSGICFKSDSDLINTMSPKDEKNYNYIEHISSESVASNYNVTEIYALDETEIEKGYTLSHNILHEQFNSYKSNIGFGISDYGMYIQGLHYSPSKIMAVNKLHCIKNKK